MTNKLRNALFTAAAFAVAPAAPAPAAAPTPAPAALPDADPALWVVKDADTTIYLFGTFHALDGKADWFNDEVRIAFDASQKVYVEVITPEDPKAMQPLLAKYAMYPAGTTLTSKLTPKGREQLAAKLTEMGAPVTAFDQLKPFFASSVFAVLGAQSIGITPDKGAEAILKAAAKTASKPVGELETLDFQLSMFDRLPEKLQVQILEQTLTQIDQMPTLFARMTKAWNAGDAEGFATMMQEMEAESPELHKVLLADRNATWARWIDERMKQPGTVFVAVGAGHLAGKDSVQDYLKAYKLKATRVAAN